MFNVFILNVLKINRYVIYDIILVGWDYCGYVIDYNIVYRVECVVFCINYFIYSKGYEMEVNECVYYFFLRLSKLWIGESFYYFRIIMMCWYIFFLINFG